MRVSFLRHGRKSRVALPFDGTRSEAEADRASADKQAGEGRLARRRTIRSQGWSVSPAGPFATTIVAASDLSVGAGVVVIFASLAHLTASAPFRAEVTRARIRPVIRDDQLEGLAFLSRFPGAFRPRRSLLGHPIPAGGLGLPCGRLTGRAAGPRRGYRVPHARAATGEGAPYTPRTAVLFPD
jgi:hypothetical protein